MHSSGGASLRLCNCASAESVAHLSRAELQNEPGRGSSRHTRSHCRPLAFMHALPAFAAFAGAAVVALVLWDTFETIVLPRTPTNQFRLTRFFYRAIWLPWAGLSGWLPRGKSRERFLSLFGPGSLLCLFVFWGLGLIAGFGLLQYGVGSPHRIAAPAAPASFWDDLYLSGATFFTLGL